MLIRRFEFDHTEGFDEPVGINRNGRTHRRDRILVMPAVPHFVSSFARPEPKEIVVAAEVEFLTAQTRYRPLNPQSFWTFKRQSGMERNHHARHIDGGTFGGKVPNGLAVPIDGRRNLLECRLSRQLRRRNIPALEQILQGSATRQAETHRQSQNEERCCFHVYQDRNTPVRRKDKEKTKIGQEELS